MTQHDQTPSPAHRAATDRDMDGDRTNARGEQVAGVRRSGSPTGDPNHRSAAAGIPSGELPHDEGLLQGGRVDGGNSGLHAAVDFDDDEIYSGRGNNARTGGTADAAGGDSGRLGPPSEQLSSSNNPQEKNPS
jgi:hypothetical protein